MTTSLVAAPNETTALDLAALSVEQLRDELVRELGFTAVSLRRQAALVQELENRGDDLSYLKTNYVHHLRRIACGQLLPEVLIHFGGRPGLVSVIGSLPINDQRHIVDGGAVKVMMMADDGPTHKMLLPAKMTHIQMRQVFAKDHIRDDAEQVAILDSERKIAKAPLPSRIGPMVVDKTRGGVTVGKHFVSLADLTQAVAMLRR